MRTPIRSMLVLGGVLLAGPVQAQNFQGARLLALSGSQSAITSGNDSIYINPAGMPMGRQYSLEANYADDFDGNLRRANVSIVDSQAGPIAAGVSYVFSDEMQGFVDGQLRKLNGHRVDLALAAIAVDAFAIGVTGRYSTYNETRGETEIDPGGFSKFDMDIGLQYRLTDSGVAFGLAAYNLLPNEEADPYMPLSWGAGIGLLKESFSAEADVRYNLKKGKPRFSLGGTVVIKDVVPIRIGGAYDRLDDSWHISGGLGFQSKDFGLDIGYTQQLAVAAEYETPVTPRIFSAALRMLFN